MAASACASGTVDTLEALTLQFTNLEKELGSMQLQYHAMCSYHGQICSSSLRDSLAQLFEVITFVNKKDRNLVNWHYKSKGLKVVLRMVGMDRRTKTVIQRTTDEMKSKISVVEDKFDETGGLFEEGVSAVKTLNLDFVRFSVSSVRAVSSHAQGVCDQFDEVCDRTREMISQQKTVSQEISERSQEVAASLQDVGQSRRDAEDRRDGCAAGSAISFSGAGLAAATAFFAPAVLPVLAAGGLFAIGAGTAMRAGEIDVEVKEWQGQEEALEKKWQTTKKEIEALESRLSELDQRRVEYSLAKEQAQGIQALALGLRRDAQSVLSDLRQARMSLVATRATIKAISAQLHECGYAKSRRDIAAKLNDTLLIIQSMGARRYMVLDQGVVEEPSAAFFKSIRTLRRCCS